jgi:hypothetical protein
MMRSDQAPYVDERQTSGAVDFDAALEAFLAGGMRMLPVIDVDCRHDNGQAVHPAERPRPSSGFAPRTIAAAASLGMGAL